jgi:hypothetical protein
MLAMLKRHEVEILLKAGHPKTEVARLSGVLLRSVKRIAEEEPVVHVDDKAERTQRQIGRPSTVASFRKQIVDILQKEPDLASLEILRRVREAGYRGGKTALYALVASLRPRSVKPLVRFEGLPGTRAESRPSGAHRGIKESVVEAFRRNHRSMVRFSTRMGEHLHTLRDHDCSRNWYLSSHSSGRAETGHTSGPTSSWSGVVTANRIRNRPHGVGPPVDTHFAILWLSGDDRGRDH